MVISKDFLWETLGQLTSEVERIDPQSVVAARVRGILTVREMATSVGDRHPRSKKAERDDNIASAYLAGASIEDVALQSGHCVSTVRAALRRRDVRVRTGGEQQRAPHKQANQARVGRIRAMRAEGKTLEEIGNTEHITRERVRQICAKNGIDTSIDARPLRPEELAIAAEYVAGESLHVVAERHQLTLGQLRYLIVKSGNEVRPSRRTPKHSPSTLARAQQAAQLYAEGKSTAEMQQALGVKAPSTYRLLAIAGVSPSRKPRRVSA